MTTTDAPRPEHAPQHRRPSGWLLALVAVAAVGALAVVVLGGLGLLFLGVAMLAGGLVVRRAAPDRRDRALAGGVAAAGAAILLLAVLLAAFLLPVSVSTDSGGGEPGPVGPVQRL